MKDLLKKINFPATFVEVRKLVRYVNKSQPNTQLNADFRSHRNVDSDGIREELWLD